MLDPYTEKYKILKRNFVNKSLNNSVHNGFCKVLGEIYGCEILDCDLTRLSHNQMLRLEVFVYNEGDFTKMNLNNWDSILINKIEILRKRYKDEINENKKLYNLIEGLNVSEDEIDGLFVIVSTFTPCLRWDLNINLDKKIERKFFRNFFKDDDFRILKEFEMLLILSSSANLIRIEENKLQSNISDQYARLLDNTSPIKNIFDEKRIHISFEEEEYFTTTFKNLKNYLN